MARSSDGVATSSDCVATSSVVVARPSDGVETSSDGVEALESHKTHVQARAIHILLMNQHILGPHQSHIVISIHMLSLIFYRFAIDLEKSHHPITTVNDTQNFNQTEEYHGLTNKKAIMY